MKTYSESRSVPAFNWHHALEHPEEYSRGELCEKASAWVTCACGNQCDIIPRFKDGEPRDKELRDSGRLFFAFVFYGSFDLAKSILAQIEARAAVLIAQLS